MGLLKQLAGVIALGAAGVCQAALIQPVSYAMPNGYGQGAGGSFNYWDASYSGTGTTTTDGAALSGGLGDLTDGIVTTETWNNVENVAGTGPFVGWTTIDPVLTFTFSAPTMFDLVRVHFDDSRFGGVSLAGSVDVTIAGSTVNYALTQGVTAGVVWADLTIANPTAVTEVTLKLNRRDVWIFADEVQFSAVPEPTGCGLAAAVIGAGMLRRRGR